MKLFKKVLVSVMLFTSLLVMSACGKSSGLVVVVGPNPSTIDPALNSAVDGATMIIHAFSGLVGYQQKEDGGLELVADCAKELPVPTELQDGRVQYVFTLKDDLKWSDGTALTAADFEYAWKRAASVDLAADYGYMFDVIDGYYGEDGEKESDKEKLNVKASVDGKQLTVVLNNAVPYFLELCAFPAYMPVKKALVEAAFVDGKDEGKWATKVDSYVGNGPYKMVEWTVESKIVFEKNEYFHNADKVKIESIEFALSDDDGAILAGYKNGTYKLIDSVPNAEIEALKEQYPDELVIAGQLGTYYINFNINADTFNAVANTEEKRQKVRLALGLLIDRNHIAKNIGKAGQKPANGFVPIGLTEPDGKTEFVAKNGPNGDGKGYYSVEDAKYADNCAQAIALLQEVGYTYDTEAKAFTNFPRFTFSHNTGTGHTAIATYLQQLYSDYGITMKIESSEWGVFLEDRKAGNYTVARNGWLGDYNDPISFLDMWTTGSGNNDVQFGKDAHANVALYGPTKDKTWAQTYDVLINEIKTSSDPAVRFAKMHQAETMLMETGTICPLYFYTDLYMVSPDLTGFFASPLGFKFFMYAELKK